MKRILALTIAAGLALTACDSKSGSTTSSSSGTSNPAPKSDTPAPAPAENPGAANTATEDAHAVSAADRTAEQTVAQFVAAMRDADYETAITLIDPTSEGFADIQDAQNTMINSEGKADQGVSLKNLMVLLFTKAWKTVEVDNLAEQDGLARYRFNFENPNIAPMLVDVRNATGEWLIIAPKNVVVIDNRDFDKAIPTPQVPPQPSTPPASGGGN